MTANKQITSILDFDNTLFKTRQFWRQELFPALQKKYKIDFDTLESVFRKSTTGKIDYFVPARFLKKLQTELSLPKNGENGLQRFFDKVVYSKKSRSYFYPGAQGLVKNLQKNNKRSLLLSYGDKEFKLRFFKACGISDLFSSGDIFITTKKNGLLKKLPLSSEPIIINDSPSEVVEIEKALKRRDIKARPFIFDPDQNLNEKLKNPSVSIIHSLRLIYNGKLPKTSMKKNQKLVFLTGTRAEFGKIKPLISALVASKEFDVHIFVTGMHLIPQYGYTVDEIVKSKFPNIYPFHNNADSDRQDLILAHTLMGFSSYIKLISPNMIVVHGDRIEALAGAIVGAVNNILVSHIEGGELSGSIDDSIRHSISKMAHLHFVANNQAKKRLVQMGEDAKSIFVIGSPDLDVMVSKDLPTVTQMKKRYEIEFKNYAVLMCHPVTTEQKEFKEKINILLDAVLESKMNYVVIHPNNDPGTDIISDLYRQRLHNNPNFKFFPSMRFEHFLTLIKEADFVIGNSSAGIRETPFYGVPSIDVGTRQNNRVGKRDAKSIFHCDFDEKKISSSIKRFGKTKVRFKTSKHFGNGKSVRGFMRVINGKKFWKSDTQKKFWDINFKI